MPKIMNVTQFWWIIPFIAFTGGYIAVSRLMTCADVQTPAIVGMPLQDALKIVSSYQLHSQIMTEIEDAEMPAGIVVEQNPRPGQHVKSSQTVYLVVTKRPAPISVPQFIGRPVADCVQSAQGSPVRVKVHALEGNYPLGYCFAQYPEAGTELPADRTVVVYSSAGITPLRILPDLRGKPVAAVREFLQAYGIKMQVLHTQPITNDHQCDACVVTEQKPLSGTFVNLSKPLLVQLHVE